MRFKVNHFVNESFNSLLQEIIKVHQTILYGLYLHGEMGSAKLS